METLHKPHGPYEKYLKRPLDFLLSACALIVLSPVFLILAVLVRTRLGSPVLFVQERPGRIDPRTGREKIFRLYKFRTMTEERDEEGRLLPDEVRLTRFGKMLRSTSLDELPELFNILVGDLSIVGPRPLLVEYLPWYTEDEHHRHDVRPGLTGWAQINGRNSVDWNRRFQLDLEYVKNVSFVFDLKILFLTIKKVLTCSDIAENTRLEEGNFAEIRKKEIESNGIRVNVKEI